MKVLMFGHNGQVGSDLKSTALRNNISICPIGRKELDVCDYPRLNEILQDNEFDVLVNCTSFHKTDEVESQASKAFAVNSFAVQRMAEFCAAKKKRFVHLSTDYVFGSNLIKSSPYDELDPTSPVNVYGASKALGENFIKISNCDHLIIRVASLFGVSGASGKGGNFVETMIKLAQERDELKVVNDQTMSPTYTKDLAICIWKLLSENVDTGTYHVVNSGEATWYDFAKAIFEKTNSNTKLKACASSEFETKARRPNYSVLSNNKTIKTIGAIRHWDDALSDYLLDTGRI